MSRSCPYIASWGLPQRRGKPKAQTQERLQLFVLLFWFLKKIRR
jgi:hypothetical protein